MERTKAQKPPRGNLLLSLLTFHQGAKGEGRRRRQKRQKVYAQLLASLGATVQRGKTRVQNESQVDLRSPESGEVRIARRGGD